MWIFTTFGFFSVVKKRGDKDFCIRARAKKDLENLKERYLPQAGDIIPTEVADYPFRMYAPPEDVALAMAEITSDIDYDNFKSEVMRTQGLKRETTYARVWSVMLDVEETSHSARRSAAWRKDDEKKGWSGQEHFDRDWYDWDWGFDRSGKKDGGRVSSVTPIRRETFKPELQFGRPISEGRSCVGDQGCEPCIPLCGDDITILDGDDDEGYEEVLLAESYGENGSCSGNCDYCGQYDDDDGCHLGLLNIHRANTGGDYDSLEDDTSPAIYLDREREQVERFVLDAGLHREEKSRKQRRKEKR